ncbi:uncharacterized protein LOC130665779 [Microplitis mediator]|uniref:uncharacterized protein LOC130665779 n=1 Tax=Microplitis mediator TaxID=375433 RepID=UPI002557864E|nr:uncharacterized protein LOC130665779 [Microplitis mediator]
MNYYYSHIPNMLWPIMTKFCTVKILWIFLFVVVTTTAFLMVMYKGQRGELKKHILGQKSAGTDIEVHKSVEKKLKTFAENLSEKEDIINKSRNDIKCAEEILNFIESKKITSVACYKNLLGDLKNDLQKIESEVKELQNEITELSKHRDNLKHDVLQQQEEYRKLIFVEELEHKI